MEMVDVCTSLLIFFELMDPFYSEEKIYLYIYIYIIFLKKTLKMHTMNKLCLSSSDLNLASKFLCDLENLYLITDVSET